MIFFFFCCVFKHMVLRLWLDLAKVLNTSHIMLVTDIPPPDLTSRIKRELIFLLLFSSL